MIIRNIINVDAPRFEPLFHKVFKAQIIFNEMLAFQKTTSLKDFVKILNIEQLESTRSTLNGNVKKIIFVHIYQTIFEIVFEKVS